MSISEETLLQAREEAETGNDQYSRGFVSAVITELLEARKEIEAAKAVYAGGETEAHALEPSDSGACTQSRDGDARIPNPPAPTGHPTDPFCIHGEYPDHQCPKCEDYPVWRTTREAEADELREKMKCLDSRCAEQPVDCREAMTKWHSAFVEMNKRLPVTIEIWDAAWKPVRESGCQKCDAEMLRVKMCEHIADGEEGWNWPECRNVCPSTMAVAELRDKYEIMRDVLEMLSKRQIATWYSAVAAVPSDGYYAGWDDAEFAVRKALQGVDWRRGTDNE